MADPRSQLEAIKAEASSLQSQILHAPTKDEALQFAISAAEHWMKALHLVRQISTDKAEKADLKLKCRTALEEAERLKDVTEWQNPPKLDEPVPSNEPRSRREEIDSWASTVAASASSVPRPAKQPSSTTTDATFATQITSIDVPVKTDTAQSIPKLTSQSLISRSGGAKENIAPQTHENLNSQANGDIPGLVTKAPQRYAADDGSTEKRQIPSRVANPSSSKSRLANVTKQEHVQPSLPLRTVSGAITTTAPRSEENLAPKVKQLKEPVSTRKRSKKEEIIVLRASKVNGFTFPPWKKEPAMEEFGQREDQVYTDSPELKLSEHQLQHFAGWARAKDALPPPTWFPGPRRDIGPVMSTPRTVDLVQDAATDCSVVASLCAGIARSERGFGQVIPDKIWPYDKERSRPIISPNSKYIVKLNFNGCWRKVVIDDRLPLSKTHRMLHVLDRSNPALLWPPLIEKAYLKVRGGYDFPGSNSCSDLWAMTGWIPEQIYLQETDTVPGQLWSRIYKAYLYGDVLVTVGTGKMSNRHERELGLEGQHNYVILDMKEADGEKLFLVKNPWVEGKGWRGNIKSDGLPLDNNSVSEDTKLVLTDSLYGGRRTAKDKQSAGTFWIGLDSVVQHFESLYLNWNPGLFRYRQDIHFQWDVEPKDATNGCVFSFPQFSFTSKEGGVVWFLLCRHFRNASGEAHGKSDAFNDGTIKPETPSSNGEDSPKGYMSIYVYDRGGERIYVKDNYLERAPYVDTPQSLLQWECKANSTYTIVADHDDLPPSSYTFTLSAFSNSTIELEPAVQKYSCETTLSGSWTQDTAGGNTGSPKYFENPQYSLKVEESTPLALVIWTRNGQLPVHMKLVHGYGKRIHRLHNRDTIVDSGEYRSGSAFAEISDVSPGTYTIICSAFEAGKTADFSLRVDSMSDCEITPVAREGAGLITMKLANACFGPQVHKIAAPLVPRRLVACTVVCRFLRATSPRVPAAAGTSVNIRSPLRVSIELGRGPERRFVVCSENGEYSNAPSVRTESVDLKPDMLSLRDLWLVLDRLSGPGGAVEEWYEVELFIDAAKACDIGVWRDWD